METKIKAVIVEDEPNNLKLLVKLLDLYCDEVEVTGTAQSIKEGLSVLNKQHPDILFLDIELPDGKGFDLLHQVPHRNFEVIFTTGYDEHAIKAIKYAAFDYLLKPLSIESLQNVVRKYKEERADSKTPIYRIFVTDNEHYRMIDSMNIFFIEAKDNYTFVHLNDNKILTSSPLKKYEENLPEFFFRTHKSYLVNVKHVQSVSRGTGGEVVLSNNKSIPVAVRRKAELMERLKDFSF